MELLPSITNMISRLLADALSATRLASTFGARGGATLARGEPKQQRRRNARQMCTYLHALPFDQTINQAKQSLSDPTDVPCDYWLDLMLDEQQVRINQGVNVILIGRLRRHPSKSPDSRD
jgi:hypothetical protein